MEFDGKLICYSLSNLLDLSTEGRFLLLCLLYEYSVENKEIDIAIDRLVKQYGVTRTVCSQVSKFLSVPTNEMAQIRRKETKVCEFDGASLSKLSSDFNGGKQEGYHYDIVVNLLTMKSNVNEKENNTNLRTSNLLLLIILLIHANSSGSVEGLSKTKIRKLMGNILVDRLDSQLKTLTEKGYILVSSRGGSGRKLFGKVSNSYLLNLGHLQSWEYQVDNVRQVNARSVLEVLEITVRNMQDISRLNGRHRNKALKSLAELLGDDLRADVRITDLILNKCGSIVSALLTERWDVIDTLDVNQCNFLDLPIFKSLLTRGGLFSVSYVEKNTSYEANEKNDSDKTHLSRKARKDQYKKEVIVTNQSFQQWLNGELDNDPIIWQAHQLTEFLLEQSLAIAKGIKELLVASANQIIKKPDNVNVVFGQVTMNGRIGDRYVLLMSLTGAERYDVYSIEASKIDKDEYSHAVSIKRY